MIRSRRRIAMTATTISTARNGERPWWLTLINGILAVVIGGILLWSLYTTQARLYLALVQLFGIWWMVQGILDIVAIFVDPARRGWKLFMGLISIISGGYVLMYPIATAVLLPKIFILVLGIWGLMYGILLLIMAFQGGGWVAGIVGVLWIIFGLALITNYYSFDKWLSVIWFAAWFAIIGGIALIVKAYSQRPVQNL
jgi:uncharacterized membrane protein HdeD (DUF308 family)